jgi:hypothetical protein
MNHIDIAFAITRFGGSFVKCLGEALLHADESNIQKIRQTWPDYWSEYEQLAMKYEAGK